MSERVHNIRFNVMGTCEQQIELFDNCPYTIDQVVQGLNGNNELTICTTVDSSGPLLDLTDGKEQEEIGRIIDSTVDAEYDEFEEIK